MTKFFEKYIDHISKYFIFYITLCYLIPYIRHFIAYLNGDLANIDYKSSQYFVNYIEFGFTKRALIGTLLHPFTINHAEILMTAITTVFFFLWVYFILRLSRVTDLRTKNILKALLAISPFTAFQIALDVGRFDIINMVILVVIIFAILKHRILSATFLTSAAILTHEAFVIYALPLIFILPFSLRYNFLKSKSFLLSGLLFYFVPIFIAILIGLYGNNDQVSQLVRGAGVNAWQRSLFDPSFGQDFFDMTLLCFVLIVIYNWLYMIYKRNNANLDLLFLTSLIYPSLFLFGTDYARWCTVIFMMVLSIIAIKIRLSRWVLEANDMRYGMFIFLGFLGPIGITNFFPFAKGALKAIFV